MPSKASKKQKPQLLVVFDTNALYTGSASDLVQEEVTKLIQESVFPDLEIRWYLPDIVRHERQYQMQKRAADLLPALAKVEKLLGHHLGIDEAILKSRVEDAIVKRCESLGLMSLALDSAIVDWNRVIVDAVYRRAPFEDGDKEKGFRDCMIAECFLQLVASSPSTPSICRIVLVTNDGLLAAAAKSRTADRANVGVLSTLNELKGLINTLVSQVSEDFLSPLKPKAGKLFFVPRDESTLFYKERVLKLLQSKFKEDLSAKPPDATARDNGTWKVSTPNFVKKTGRRVQWSSRISVECEATKEAPRTTWASGFNAVPAKTKLSDLLLATPDKSSWGLPGIEEISGAHNTMYLSQLGNPPTEIPTFYPTLVASARTTTHRGVDIYEVVWSVDVTTRGELRKAGIDEIKHIGLQWEQVN
jgi:PIN domain-containing protein